MKIQRIFSQSVVATLTAFVCVGGALLVPISAHADAKPAPKSKPSGPQATGGTSTGGSTSGGSTTTTGSGSTTGGSGSTTGSGSTKGGGGNQGGGSGSKPGGGSGSKPGGGGNQGSATAGAGDIKLLEAALSITLTDAQKAAITAAATTRDASVKAALDAYRTQVAAIFGLTATDLDAKIKSAGKGQKGDFATLLATVLGRALTDAEKTALSDAAVTCDAAIRAAYDTYGTTVATLLGTTATELQTKVQAYLDSQSKQGGSSGGKGGGKDCPPPPSTGTTGTAGTGTTGTGTSTQYA